MRFAGWLLFLMASAALSQPPTPQIRQEAARKLLEKLIRRYDAAQTLIASGVLINTTQSPQRKTSVKTCFTLYVRRPNLLRFVAETTTPEGIKQRQTVVADGRNIFVEYPHLRQVLKRPMGKGETLPQAPFGDVFAVTEWVRRLKSTRVVGEEAFGRRRATIIRAETEDGTPVQLWVADDTVWRGQIVIEGQRLAARMGTDPKKPNPIAEAMKQTTLILTVQFDRVRFNAPIPEATFTYKAPAGFKVVEKLEMPSPPLTTPKP